MRKGRFSDEQIIQVLKEPKPRASTKELGCTHGIRMAEEARWHGGVAPGGCVYSGSVGLCMVRG